ncbi:hypothetical protein F9B85_11530 [Heliorestis acidaminivorans]|uniref:Uncharacterized protein n=1 Tax=Heliorestis acidaminivorans TaxID=553427 RepID=A0A6I0EP51_9FIRM|nr:hypothetical protein [Heliorestis acidaminivorans]KAB2951657.1 hypothetical protein F9B85_11530 [Heliorestis acidaminivorans]
MTDNEKSFFKHTRGFLAFYYGIELKRIAPSPSVIRDREVYFVYCCEHSSTGQESSFTWNEAIGSYEATVYPTGETMVAGVRNYEFAILSVPSKDEIFKLNNTNNAQEGEDYLLCERADQEKLLSNEEVLTYYKNLVLLNSNLSVAKKEELLTYFKKKSIDQDTFDRIIKKVHSSRFIVKSILFSPTIEEESTTLGKLIADNKYMEILDFIKKVRYRKNGHDITMLSLQYENTNTQVMLHENGVVKICNAKNKVAAEELIRLL